MNKKLVSKESLNFFFGFVSQVSQFSMKFWISFWGFTEFLEYYDINSFTKSAIGFKMSINWTYLELWVDS